MVYKGGEFWNKRDSSQKDYIIVESKILKQKF